MGLHLVDSAELDLKPASDTTREGRLVEPANTKPFQEVLATGKCVEFDKGGCESALWQEMYKIWSAEDLMVRRSRPIIVNLSSFVQDLVRVQFIAPDPMDGDDDTDGEAVEW